MKPKNKVNPLIVNTKQRNQVPSFGSDQLQDNIYDTSDALAYDCGEELRSAFIKSTINPYTGVKVKENPDTYNIFDTADSEFEILAKKADSVKQASMYDMGSLYVQRSAITQHFYQLAFSAFSDAINLANLNFTNLLASKGRLLVDKYRDGQFHYRRFEDIDSRDVIADPFNLYCLSRCRIDLHDVILEDVNVSALFDLRIYAVCDTDSIKMLLIPCLEANFNDFKRLLLTANIENISEDYDLYIEAFNEAQINLLYSLEGIVEYLWDAATTLIHAGKPGSVSTNPLKLYEAITTVSGGEDINAKLDMTIKPNTIEIDKNKNDR